MKKWKNIKHSLEKKQPKVHLCYLNVQYAHVSNPDTLDTTLEWKKTALLAKTKHGKYQRYV